MNRDPNSKPSLGDRIHNQAARKPARICGDCQGSGFHKRRPDGSPCPAAPAMAKAPRYVGGVEHA